MREAHYTTDGGKLAPYPGMTDEQLEDFETWADAQDAEARAVFSAAWKWVLVALAVGALIWRG